MGDMGTQIRRIWELAIVAGEMTLAVRNILAVLGSAFLAACTDSAFFVANLPAAFSRVSVTRDLSYGNGPSKTLDLYIPKRVTQDPLPVIIFLYGGRWTDGKKRQYAFAANTLAQEGFFVAVPDYRKYPDVKFPVFAQDGAEAVAWVHDHIGSYGGDRGQIFLSGHSAGAHIGALIAADPKYLGAHHKSRSVITAFAGLAGPYDFVPEAEDLKDMFGPPERYGEMQVPTFIDGGQPPMLLLHGRKDDTVRLYNLERLAGAINAKGGYVETRIYPKVDHIQIVGALTVFWRYKAPVKDDLVGFFRAQSKLRLSRSMD